MLLHPDSSSLVKHDELFSERRWQVLKMRLVALFAGITYPAWGPIYAAIYENVHDSIWMRLAVSSLCWVVVYLSFTKRPEARHLDFAFDATAFSLTYYMLFLVYENGLKDGYVLAAYCMLFATGAVLGSFRSLVIYYTSCLALNLVLTWIFSASAQSSIFLIGGIFCAAAASTVSHASIHKLLNYLRESRLRVESVNRSQDNMLNTLGEGYFSFDRQGICKKVFSKACLSLIETNPDGKNVFEVLRLPAEDSESYGQLLEIAFASLGRFDLFATLMPKSFPHSQGKTISLQFRPVIENGSVTEVMVVATDETALTHAKREAELERRELRMIATIAKERRFFSMFVKGTREALRRYADVGDSSRRAEEFRRFLHSTKGAASLFGMIEMSEKIHGLESVWPPAHALPLEAAECVSLSKAQAKILEDAFSHFLTAHAYLFGEEFEADRRIEIRLSEFLNLIEKREFRQSAPALQESLAKFALVPIEKYLTSFSELIQKMASNQKKKMDPLNLKNGQLLIYPERYEQLFSSLVHVFTNAVEHGLESRQERRQKGKPEAGQITVDVQLETNQEKSWLVLNVSDDGRGIDPQLIRAKLQAGPLTDLPDEKIIQRIFDTEFTTRAMVTETAGRGIGLSAVREATDALGGGVEVSSVFERSTTIKIRVPFLTPLTESLLENVPNRKAV